MEKSLPFNDLVKFLCEEGDNKTYTKDYSFEKFEEFCKKFADLYKQTYHIYFISWKRLFDDYERINEIFDKRDIPFQIESIEVKANCCESSKSFYYTYRLIYTGMKTFKQGIYYDLLFSLPKKFYIDELIRHCEKYANKGLLNMNEYKKFIIRFNDLANVLHPETTLPAIDKMFNINEVNYRFDDYKLPYNVEYVYLMMERKHRWSIFRKGVAIDE